MTDILTKSFLQSQSGASNGLYQDLAARQPLQHQDQDAAEDGVVDAIEQSKQQISESEAFGAESQMGRRDDSERQNEQIAYFTVMIKNASGEQRILSVKAGSADGAKNAAQAALGDGDELLSVDESTVPAAPDPNRGLVV